MASKKVLVKMTQIAVGGSSLYGLDVEGRVWKFNRAKGSSFAFWSQLTNYGSKYEKDVALPMLPQL